MTNLTIKEQLQALSLAPAMPANEKSQPAVAKPKSRPERNTSKPPKPMQKPTQKLKPAWLEYAQYGVELLKAYYPLCFKDMKEIQPLKIGIKQDLVKDLSTQENIVTSDKACMVTSLAYYVNSISYHKAVVESALRIDLEGNSAGTVTAEEAKYSVDCRENKGQKKKPTAAMADADIGSSL